MTEFSQGEIVLIQFLIPAAVPALICFVPMISPDTAEDETSQHSHRSQCAEQQGERKARKRGGAGRSRNRKAATKIVKVTTIYILTSFLSEQFVWSPTEIMLGEKRKGSRSYPGQS